MKIELNLPDTLGDIIRLYKEIYGKESLTAACSELIKYGLRYKDFQRQKEGLPRFMDILDNFKVKEKTQRKKELEILILKEKQEWIDKVLAFNSEKQSD